MGDNDPFEGVNYGEFSFRAKQWVLKNLAGYVATAVPASAAIPALTCFRLRLRDGILTLAATDMERTVIATSSAVYTEDSGDFEAYLPAKKLQAILKEAPDTDITVAVKKDRATVTAGSGSWALSLPDASDYPELAESQGLGVKDYPREQLLAALKAVRHVVCKDAGRPPLTQVAIARPKTADGAWADEDVWCVTASDGTRFARARIDAFPQEMCIPSSVLDDLMRLLGASKADHVGVGATEDVIAFIVGPVLLAVARRTTPFPDMDQQLLGPALGNDQPLSVDRDELAAAVRRVSINADKGTAAIALEVSGETVAVVSRDKFGNSASESVHAAWEGKDRVLCVNHVFLGEMLAAHPDKTVTFRLGKDLGKRRSAVLLTGEGLTQVMAQMAPALVGY